MEQYYVHTVTRSDIRFCVVLYYDVLFVLVRSRQMKGIRGK